MREERKKLKGDFQDEKCPIKKKEKLGKYIEKQHEIKEEAVKEESEQIYERFRKMAESGTSGAFWRERKRIKKDDGASWLITKDKEGKRIFDPNRNKENIADYYEDLYSKKTVKNHPYHVKVRLDVQRLKESSHVNTCHRDQVPTRQEVKEAIEKKKSGKSTTDWKNEIIKKGGDEMVDFVYPVIRAFWKEELAPM